MSMTDKARIDESEWQAQERGVRAALGGDASGLDAAAVNYRAVAKALMSFPRSEPPDNFAAEVVQRVAGQDAGFERLLSRLLLAVFLVVSILVGVRYGEQWWQPLHQTLSDDALDWLLTGMGCLILSWICSRLLASASHAGEPRRTS